MNDPQIPGIAPERERSRELLKMVENTYPSRVPVHSSEDLGLLVERTRKGRGYSQQAFADLAGVGRRFISEVENGKPTAEIGKVLQVLTALGVDMELRVR